MKTHLQLERSNPYVQAMLLPLARRMADIQELLKSKCPSPLETGYAAYLRTLPQDPESALFGHELTEEWIVSEVLRVQKLSRQIRDEGYDETLGAVEPILVAIFKEGQLFLGDGTRRALVLFCCNRPVTASVYHRDPAWETVVAAMENSDAWLYEPHPHPDLAGLPVIRPDLTRFNAIRSYLVEKGVKKIVDLGSNYGVGAVTLAKGGDLDVTGLEHCGPYETLQRSLFQTYPDRKLTSILGSRDQCPTEGIEAYVGLSVWHHLAQTVADLDAWVDHVAKAKHLVIELPEESSTTWPPSLVEETRLPTTRLSEFILNKLARVGFRQTAVIYMDEEYRRVTRGLEKMPAFTPFRW